MEPTRVAFITGAGSGIGRAIAALLARRQYIVAATDLNFQAAGETAQSIVREGGQAVAVACDVTSLDSVESAVHETLKHHRRIDILVNNAGWDKVEPFLKSEPETWERVIRINLMGQLNTCKTILPVMIEKGFGRVVNIASDAARVGSSGEAVYSAAKGGVVSFTKTLAREMARYKINVNCVAPGPTDTPLFQEIGSYNQGIAQALEKAIPFRRLATPEDIAGAVAFLVSDDAQYITGQTLSVSGGLTMV